MRRSVSSVELRVVGPWTKIPYICSETLFMSMVEPRPGYPFLMGKQPLGSSHCTSPMLSCWAGSTTDFYITPSTFLYPQEHVRWVHPIHIEYLWSLLTNPSHKRYHMLKTNDLMLKSWYQLPILPVYVPISCSCHTKTQLLMEGSTF
jgi:hypothetical protein